MISISTTVSFRIPRELKRRMDALSNVVNWSEEVRKFLERRVKELEQLKAIEELENLIKRLPKLPKGTATRYVRVDRDSY